MSASPVFFLDIHILQFRTVFHLSVDLLWPCRRVTSIRRPCRLWFTPFPVLHHTTLRCGRPPPPPTATSARGFCGASLDRACAAPSVASSVTRSVKICLMPIVYRVRWFYWVFLHSQILSSIQKYTTVQKFGKSFRNHSNMLIYYQYWKQFVLIDIFLILVFTT